MEISAFVDMVPISPWCRSRVLPTDGSIEEVKISMKRSAEVLRRQKVSMKRPAEQLRRETISIWRALEVLKRYGRDSNGTM